MIGRIRHRLAGLGHDHKRIASGAMRVAFFLLIGKFAGAIKEIAVAHRYGISSVVDAYQFTMTMANWLPSTLVGVFGVIFIPVLVKVKQETIEQRTRFIREMMGWVLCVGMILGLGLWLFWPWVLQYAGGHLQVETKRQSEALVMAFAPASIMIVLVGACMMRLRAHERHINNLLDSLPAIGILLFLFIMPGNTTVYPLLLGTLFGYLVQTLWMLCLARNADGGAKSLPVPGCTSSHWKGIMHAAGIMLIGQVLMSFVNPLDQMAAAMLGDNANATIGYSNRFLALIIGLGAASVGRAALPVLADIHGKGQIQYAKKIALKWSLLMLFAGVVVLLVGWFFAPWIVQVMYQRGAFTAQDTVEVSTTLRYGMLQLPFYFAVLILVQLMASQGRYRLMTLIAVANFALKAILNVYMAPRFGVQGIMVATAMMYALSFISYFFVTARWHVEPLTKNFL